MPFHEINPHNFPLPTLGPRLRKATEVIHDQNTGVVLFRGLDPSLYSRKSNVIIHAGLASYIGEKRAMPGSGGGDRTVLREFCCITCYLSDTG
jgi:hypothetical protein